MGKGEGKADEAAGGGFADNDSSPQGQSGWMEPGKTKPVISWTYERQREGFKIMQQKDCDALLPGVSQRIGQAFAASFPSFTPSVTSWVHSSASMYTHTRSHMYKHTQLSHLFFSGETRFYLQNPHCLRAPLPYSPPHTHRSPSCPPFVYFTPSIMQGLISQSRFELRHASAKSGEQNFCAGGSFPFTLA